MKKRVFREKYKDVKVEDFKPKKKITLKDKKKAGK